MTSFSMIDPTKGGDFQSAWESSERAFLRGWHDDARGGRKAVLAVVAGPETHGAASADRLMREYELREQLNGAWAARPLALLHEGGHTILILEDHGGEPLDRLLGSPLEARDFLRLAVGLSGAIGMMHDRRIIHKDIKPANVFVNRATRQVWLTGFGIASRLLRERQMPDQPELIAGTLA